VVSFAPPQGGITLNPTLIGPATITGSGFSFIVGGTATELIAGQPQAIAVVGPGLDVLDAANIAFVGGEITIESSSLHASIGCSGTICRPLFHCERTPECTLRLAPLLLRRGSAMTGAVFVRGIQPPTPDTSCDSRDAAIADSYLAAAGRGANSIGRCVGDCDSADSMTSTIVVMVNIALGARVR
jgi:hypothetical protein